MAVNEHPTTTRKVAQMQDGVGLPQDPLSPLQELDGILILINSGRKELLTVKGLGSWEVAFEQHGVESYG